MLPASEMDQNAFGTVDDSIDPNIFNLIDVGNSAAPNDQDNFKFFDDFISSTELGETDLTSNETTAAAAAEVVSSISIQPSSAVQQQQQQQQPQLLQNVLQQQQAQPQQQQTPSLGNVIMAMGQPSQTQTLAVAGSDGQTQVLPNQTTILQSNLGSQHLGSPFILKTSSGTSIQLASTAVTQSTSTISATPQQFLPAASGLSSITPSQRSSPLLSRSITPNLSLSAASASRPGSVASTPAPLSGINLLQLQQSPQLTQHVPLSNLVANQQGLQGHAVLAAQGSNIVHTQNALIQNPNVVNVNVAHVLSNQLPQLQGTILQTAQGKILIQPAANNQQLPQQLCLGTQPVQMAGTQPVHMTGGQPVQLAGGQTVQMAPNVGLGQPAVIAQPQPNVALGTNSGVGQQQASYNLINLGGSQGQILFQRMPSSGASVTQAQTLTQGPILLRTVNGQQQLLQQPTLQSTTSTTQLPQQLLAQAGSTQNIPIQQLLAGGAPQSLRLVGQPSTAAPQPAPTLPTTTAASNIVLQPLVTGNQKKGLLPQGADGRRLALQAGKSGTVTLNLGGQNLNLQQLQGLQGLQLTTSQQQPILVQQQQQQQQQQQLTVSASSLQQTVVQTATAQTIQTSGSKKSKNKNSSAASSSSSASSVAVSSASIASDNILSTALISCGILEDEDLMNGSDFTDSTASQAGAAATPSPSPLQTAPTPTPPPPTPPSGPKGKSKKKKKEVSGGVVQPVVLSSTAAKTITITTASATVVTTTLSQSTQSLTGQPMTANAYSLPASATPFVTVSTPSAVFTSAAQDTTSVAATQTVMSTSLTTSSAVSAVCKTNIPVRGRHGGQTVTVKPVTNLQNMSLADKQLLAQIQLNMKKLSDQPSLDQKSLAVMQQLDMQKKKILAAYQPASSVTVKPQSGSSSVQQAGGSLAIQPQQAAPEAPQAVEQTGQPMVAQVTLSSQPVTPSTPHTTAQAPLRLLQIQPKPSKLLTTTTTTSLAASSSSSASVVSQPSKPVLVAGGVAAANSATTNLVTHMSGGSTFQKTVGDVIMTMSSPLVGQAGSAQPQMLRIQIGGAGSAQKAVGVPSVAATAAATTTAAQHVVLQSSSSPQKIVMATNLVTSASTVVTASPVVNSSPNQARPVQIKIANQLLTLQLSQQQQEKLELHLSRMTMEQQQVFLRQQHHVLTKLQHRVEVEASSQPAGAQGTTATVGSSLQGPVPAAPTLVANVSAAGDGTGQAVHLVTPATVVATPTAQLPATVQALTCSQPQSSSSQTTATTTSASGSIRRSLDIPQNIMIKTQLGKDQEHALKPDTKTPFKDYREACRRLMRYHVFQSQDPTLDDMEEFDHSFEVVSKDLIDRKDAMFTNYRRLMAQDSMRKYPTAEQVLISRMWCTEMREKMQQERQQVEQDPESFAAMPLDYLEKDLTQVSEPEDSDVAQDEDEDSDVGKEEDGCERDEDVLGESSMGDVEPAPDEEVLQGVDDEVGGVEYSAPSPPNPPPEADVPAVEEAEEQLHCDSFSEGPLDTSAPLSDLLKSPAREESPPTQSSNWTLSSPVKEEQSSFVSESPPSSPPRVDPPPRTMVKLVIRNDGKGFTSKFVERRRSSMQAERRTLRSRSNSGQERPVAIKRVKKEPVTEEVEYIDVDNSKYNKGVSVKLERLSERYSQEYGLCLASRTSCGAEELQSHKPPVCENTSVQGSRGAGGGGKNLSSKSNRKRRRGEAAPFPVDVESIKQEHDFSGISGDDGGGGGVGGSGGGSHDKQGDTVFRDFTETKAPSRRSPFREFYVGSASESLDHFDSDDDDDGPRYTGDVEVVNKEDSRGGPVCSSPVGAVTTSRGGSPNTSHSQQPSHPVFSYGRGEDEQFCRPYSHLRPGPSHKSEANLVEYVPDSPTGNHELQPPAFSQHIPGFIHTDQMFDSSPGQEGETSFELHNADLQGNMVNPQMQSTIENFLNGSGSSDSGDPQGAAGLRTASRRYSAGAGADNSVEYELGEEGLSRTGRHRDMRHHSATEDRDWEDSSEPDLDAAVQSILSR